MPEETLEALIQIMALLHTDTVHKEISVSDTVPTIQIKTDDATVSHEATAGKIDENQLFYLMSR